MPIGTSSLSENFRTKDFWLAGALLASKKQLLRLDWLDGRAIFIFSCSVECEELAQAYWAYDLKVTAKGFADALRTLKDRLYGNGNAGRNKPR